MRFAQQQEGRKRNIRMLRMCDRTNPNTVESKQQADPSDEGYQFLIFSEQSDDTWQYLRNICSWDALNLGGCRILTRYFYVMNV